MTIDRYLVEHCLFTKKSHVLSSAITGKHLVHPAGKAHFWLIHKYCNTVYDALIAYRIENLF